MLACLPLVLAASPAFAQGGAAGVDGSTRLVVVIDDRDMAQLRNPALVVDGQRVRMLDDGSMVGDLASDRIWMTAQTVGRVDTIAVTLFDEDRELTSLDLALPDADRAFFAYKLRPDRTLALDPSARAVEGVGDPVAEAAGGASTTTAAATGSGSQEQATLGDDEVKVRIALDDRGVEAVSAPRIVIAQDGVAPVLLTDDGSVSGDIASDRIWMGEVVVQRSQYLSFSVHDGETELAELTVFLPSSGQAAVSLLTTGTDPAVELSAEPTATSGTQGPSATGGGGGTEGLDRLSYVLWTGVALFAIAFAYLRSVVWRAWREEIRPVVQKLDRQLDQLEARRDEEGRA